MKEVPVKETGDQYTAPEFTLGVSQEAQNFVLKSGQALDENDDLQMQQGVLAYAGGANQYVDSGIANAYILTSIVTDFANTTLGDGQRFNFTPQTTNTGASTANINGTGVIDIVNPDATPLDAQAIEALQPTSLEYDLGANQFILIGGGISALDLANETSPNEGTGLVGHTNQTLKAYLGSSTFPKYADSGVANQIELTPDQSVVTVPTALGDGVTVVFRPTVANTLAAVTLQLGSNSAKTVKLIAFDGTLLDVGIGYFNPDVYYEATYFTTDDVFIVQRLFKEQDDSNIAASINADGEAPVSIRSSKNIASFTRLAEGECSVTFERAFPNTNYAITAWGRGNTAAGNELISAQALMTKTVSVFEFTTISTNGNNTDIPEIGLAFYLNQ